MKEYEVERIKHIVASPSMLLSRWLAFLDRLWGKLSHQRFLFVTVDGKKIEEPCKIFVRMCSEHDPD